jgi:phosphoribosylformylglycinamidine synthase
MRAAVVIFPGSNADHEMIHTLSSVCGFQTSTVWHTESSLDPGLDLVVIPGGFAYGDYLRCGALARSSPVLHAVKAHALRGGLVLGVCNGFQILTEVGLLEGALTRNAHLRFECRDIHVRVEVEGAFTHAATGPKSVWRLPIAHAEGRYYAPPAVLERLEGEGLIGLRYASASGELGEEYNPNGSLHHIAGIYGGPHRNIFGLMPHPERMSERALGGDDGRRIFLPLIARAAAA